MAFRVVLQVHLFVLFCLTATSAFCENRIIYLSDVDDTIIQSNIAKKRALVWDVITRKKKPAFTGMSLLFAEILRNNPQIEFQYLSGTPEMLRQSLTQKLKEYGFPKGKMTLRRWIPIASDLTFGLWGDTIFSTRRYKYKKLKAIFMANPDAKFVLFGDDVEFDPYLYLKIAGEFPGQVEQAYIRTVKGRLKEDFGDGIIVQFSTEVDIVLNEYDQHRLSEKSAFTLIHGLTTLIETQPENVFARFIRRFTHPRFPTHLSLSPPLRDLMGEFERAFDKAAHTATSCFRMLGPPEDKTDSRKQD